MRKLLLALALLLAPCAAQAADVQDPCTVLPKSSAAISVSSATTTSLVAAAAGKAVYVCGYIVSNVPSATSAATFLFEYGTGASCTSPTALTGTFGAGYTTATAPIVYVNGNGNGTILIAPAAATAATANGLCILTAGTTVNIQGVVSYVQN